MSKINNKILLAVLLVLLFIFLGKRFFGGSGERNFRDTLVAVDTAQVNKIVIYPRAAAEGDDINFTKTGTGWEVARAAVKDEANISSVKGMLGNMINMKPKRLVAKSSDKWAQYEVNDSLGTRVQAFANDELVADFVLGKFNFQQASRSMSNFVRLTEDEEVYSVDGFLSSSFNQEFNNFRDRTFVSLTPENITSVRFEYPADSAFALNKIESKWQIDGVQADSAAVSSYLSGLRNMTKSEFADDFAPEGKSVAYQLAISGDNMQSITVSAYLEADKYILHSTLNEGAFFDEGSLQIFDKLFVNKESLFPKDDQSEE
ncbi:DUF4340 domain-containing protein [Fulvivirgaceae bacterium BMA12]|uniref:DUF4340 domain-containing protein n=1 Tax=Agaribacillus aureus TaxID=3051825 RepID=A0ABT8L051_9BACT|nr:DUF4340 domain-containing protein [Fulvivirgaceae bacterium BMA12]